MASVTARYKDTLETLAGPYVRRWQLVVTGLAQGTDNTIPHGLPCGLSPGKPVEEGFEILGRVIAVFVAE